MRKGSLTPLAIFGLGGVNLESKGTPPPSALFEVGSGCFIGKKDLPHAFLRSEGGVLDANETFPRIICGSMTMRMVIGINL